MVRQKLKHRFRKLTTSPALKKDDSTTQVSTLLDTLRKEARFNNDSTSTSLSPNLPQPAFNYFMREQAERRRQERGEPEIIRQQISSSAPPWQIACQNGIVKNETELLIKDRKEKRQTWDGEEIRTITILHFEIKDFDVILRRDACFFS